MIIDLIKLKKQAPTPAYLAVGHWHSSKEWYRSNKDEVRKKDIKKIAKPLLKVSKNYEDSFYTHQLSTLLSYPIDTLYVDYKICAVEVDSSFFKIYQGVDSQKRIETAFEQIKKLNDIDVFVFLVVKNFEEILAFSLQARTQMTKMLSLADNRGIEAVLHTQKLNNKILSDAQLLSPNLKMVGTGTYELSPSSYPNYQGTQNYDNTRASVGHKIQLDKALECSVKQALVPETKNVFSLSQYKKNKNH